MKSNYYCSMLQLIYLHSTKCDSVCLRHEIPSINFWTTQMIKDRQAYEIRNGGFGILDRYEEDINEPDSSKRKVCFNIKLLT